MESISNHKRRGWSIKAKLMPFYRTQPKSATPPAVPYSSKVVKPNQTKNAFLVQQDHYMQISPAKQKAVSNFIVPTTDANLDKFDKLFGGGTGDESVDTRADTYISYVQERFKLERINSE
ncbi:hypothetical protein SLEP1_g35490 [Rubroshorea leprosula]|uniref:Uncharacterized protein n=1 Tax=Rubroshorea leprosula TaxID=152421 RepID=A0AAV5KNF8_9ROSI|nr:hypothetical protein SLEP1_g35490 [Rubroshorea leprosula]